MKKLIIIPLILCAVMLTTLTACGNGAIKGNAPNDDPTQAYEKEAYLQAINNVIFAKDTRTDVTYTLTGGINTTYGYTVDGTGKEFIFTVNDGSTKTYTDSFDSFNYNSGFSDQKNDYEAGPEDPQEYSGALNGLVFTSPSKLFNLKGNIKSVKTESNADNTVSYYIYVYEEKVKNAFPALINEFGNIKDVTNLEFIIKVSGYKTEITVKLSTNYIGVKAPVDITLTVTHIKIIKYVD